MRKGYEKTHSITDHTEATTISAILDAALEAADPVKSICNAIKRCGDSLLVGDRSYDLNQFDNVYLVGAGKAALTMTKGAATILGDRIRGGIVIAKHLDQTLLDDLPPSIRFLQGSHPVPDSKSVQSTRQLTRLLEQCTERDLVVCLISGGGSALMMNPVSGVSLADIQALTRLLLSCGADIGEINTLRKHLDQIKGGRLARLAYPAKLVTFILSDVIGSPLDVIASGPTVADPTTYQDALRVVQKYHLENEVSSTIMMHLNAGVAGKVPESVKAGETCLVNTHNLIVSSNYQAAIKGVEAAKSLGLQSMLLTTYLRGEARQAGTVLASVLREGAITGNPLARPMCIVLGGETTVSLKGKGKGGRNTELALGAVRELAGLDQIMLVTLATDGEDGPTDAAGAVVTGETLQRGLQLDLLPEAYLQNNDSYHYIAVVFEALGDLLKIGPTGTNVNDYTMVYLFAF